MKRFNRMAVPALGSLALLGTFTLRADATTVAETTFSGNIRFIGGLGYPVLTLPTTVTVPTVACLPLPTDPVPQCHPVYDHQRLAVYSSNTCVDEAIHVAKPGKPLESTGGCNTTASGTVSGHCGLAAGELSGTHIDSKGQVYTFNIHFTEVFGEWTLTGHVTKQSTGRTGSIAGEALASPQPSQPGGQTCTNKTQEDFFLIGETTIAISTI